VRTAGPTPEVDMPSADNRGQAAGLVPRSSRPLESATSRAWTLAVTSIAYFMVTLDALVVITALPAIRHDVHADIGTLEWTVNAYTLGAAVIITAAALGDRFGRRRLFTLGLSVFTLASAACALAPNAGTLIAARAVQGIGGAMIIPLSLTLLTTAFPPERRGAVVGIWGGLAGIAVASGPLIGGAVTEGLDWHWIFWVNVPVGLVAAIAARTRLDEARGPATRLDLPAMLLVGGAGTAVIWALVNATSAGWGSVGTVSGLILGAVALAVLIWWERRAPAPMLPPTLLRNRGFSAATTATLLMTAALMAAVFLTAQYFQSALGLSPLAAGLRLLPWTATPLVVAPLAGALADRVGARRVLASGLLLQGVGLAWFAAMAGLHPAYGELVLPLVVAGVGVSMALPSGNTAAVSAVVPAQIGTASGVANTMQRTGGALGIAVVSTVFASYGHLGAPAAFVAGFQPAVTVAAGLSLLGAVAALAAPRRRAVAVAPVGARA
jgi:EmrB/QacA subfamily drug resistance transporter